MKMNISKIWLGIFLLACLGNADLRAQQPRKGKQDNTATARLHTVTTTRGLHKWGGTVVKLRGRYQPFDLDVDNIQAFEGQALIYLRDGRPVIIGSERAERLRPANERAQFKGKSVEIIGTVFSVPHHEEGESCLNIGLIEQIQSVRLVNRGEKDTR
jgi:hypothetical protein